MEKRKLVLTIIGVVILAYWSCYFSNGNHGIYLLFKTRQG